MEDTRLGRADADFLGLGPPLPVFDDPGDGSRVPSCLDHPKRDQWWFPGDLHSQAGRRAAATAAAVCRSCPVRVECAAFAEELRPTTGVWGGVAWTLRQGQSANGFRAEVDLETIEPWTDAEIAEAEAAARAAAREPENGPRHAPRPPKNSRRRGAA